MPNLSDRATGLTNVNVLSLNQLPGDGPSASADQIKLYAKADGKVYTKILEDGQEVEKEVGSGGGASVEIIEDDTAEEFAVGDILYFDGTNYAKALASATNTAEVVGIVSEKLGSAGSYKYTVTTAGYVESGLELDVAGDPLVAGSVYFLSADTAGGLTLNEPNVVGQVSRPVLLVSAARTAEGEADAKGFVLPYRGIVVGGSNARTSLSLNDGGSTDIQDMSNYEAGELSGWIFVDADAPLRFYVEAQVSKNGAGDDYNISYQTSGDTPPSGFDMNVSAAGMVAVVLPSITGFSSANINYSLNAAAVGVDLPLSISGENILEATSSVRGTVLKPNGMLRLDTGTAYGTVGTQIRRFANITEQVGDAFTYADSSTDGMSVTANRDMIVSVSYTDRDDNLNAGIGISVNASSLTDHIIALSASERIASAYTGIDMYVNLAATFRVSAGDVIRAHTFSQPNSTNSAVQFVITEVVRL